MAVITGDEATITEVIRAAARNADVRSDDPIGALVEALAQLPEEIRRADRLSASDIAAIGRAVTAQVDLQVAKRSLQLDMVGWAAGAVVLVLVGAGGWWWGWVAHGDRQLVAGVSVGQQECSVQANGGTLCRIPVWSKLPPAAGR